MYTQGILNVEKELCQTTIIQQGNVVSIFYRTARATLNLFFKFLAESVTIIIIVAVNSNPADKFNVNFSTCTMHLFLCGEAVFQQGSLRGKM